MNRFLILTSILLVFAAGCALNEPRGPQGSFSVKVLPYFGKDVRVYIQAYERVNGQRGPVLVSKRVTGDGVTGFVLPLGKEYGVRAYADLDADGRSGPGDPSAILDGLQSEEDLNAQGPPHVLTLPGTGESPDWPQKGGGGSSAPAPAPPSSEEALLQKGIDRVRAAAPQLPIPPPPVPPPSR